MVERARRGSCNSPQNPESPAIPHADWKAETDYFISCTKVWEKLMLRLKAVAEGKGLGPLFSKDGLASQRILLKEIPRFPLFFLSTEL